MIDRPADEERLAVALRRAPVVLLVGPRQAGKSTLARAIASDHTSSTFFDLENPRHQSRLADPLLALEDLTGLVIIDEAQHAPGLFPVLRVLADRPEVPARFLVLGSASPDLVGLASESLAGRVEIVELGGFRLADVGVDAAPELWMRGGLPASFTQRDDTDSIAWRENYVRTFLTRDLAELGVRVPAAQMRRFWTMVAHYHAQTWNGAELARALAISQPAVRRYLDALTDALMIRQLQPWFANVGKRLVRSPKVYVRDSGLLHTLLGIGTESALLDHPKVGASWEGFVIEQLAAGMPEVPLYFWATHAGAELDLLFVHDGHPIGVEVKRTSTPSVTPSIRNAIADLGLRHVYVIHPGPDRYPLSDTVTAVPLADLAGSWLDPPT
ncbi:MAG: ATP-binding protein [Acidimicrobiales bacterium]